MSNLQVKSDKNTLVIRLSGMEQVYAIGAIVALIIAPILIFNAFPIGGGEQIVILAILMIAGIGVYKKAKVAFFKEYLLFNKVSQTVFYGNALDKVSQGMYEKEERKIAFSEIDFLAIKKEEREEDYDLYLITMELKNKESLLIYEDISPDGTTKVAEQIGAFIDKEVKRL
jgi:hypothetical protein